MITGFPDDRTASILTDDTAAVNNLISFWRSTFLQRFKNIDIHTLDPSCCGYSNHIRPLMTWNSSGFVSMRKICEPRMLGYIDSAGPLDFNSRKQFWFCSWDQELIQSITLKSKSEIDLNWDLDSNLYLELILWSRTEIKIRNPFKVLNWFMIEIRNWFWTEIRIRNTF